MYRYIENVTIASTYAIMTYIVYLVVNSHIDSVFYN